jgi:hypothetical protein
MFPFKLFYVYMGEAINVNAFISAKNRAGQALRDLWTQHRCRKSDIGHFYFLFLT